MQSVDGVLIVSPCHVEKLTRDIAKTRDIEIGVHPFFSLIIPSGARRRARRSPLPVLPGACLLASSSEARASTLLGSSAHSSSALGSSMLDYFA